MDRRAIERAFYDYFRIVPIYSDTLKDVAYRIRYQVYCEELAFEDRHKFPDRLEIDSYDRHSQHLLLLHKVTNSYVGCIRLVLPDPDRPTRPLPFELACGSALNSRVVELAKKNGRGYGEISRLALCPGLWRRRHSSTTERVSGDQSDSESQKGRGESPLSSRKYRHPHINLGREHWPAGTREQQLMGLGLYLAGAALALNNGLGSVFAMMEPRLARRLRGFGIHFQQVGDVVEYRGLRGPFQITRDGLFSELCPSLRGLLDVLVADLRVSNPFERAAS